MPSIKSVDDIKSSLLRPSLTSHFYVEIPVPSQGANSDSFKQKLQGNGVSWPTRDQDTLNLLCSEAVLPGSSLATFEINNDRTGVTERHVHRRMFDDRIDFTFYVDADKYLPIRFFETWMKGIMNEDEKSVNVNYHYRPKYPDEYIADQGLKVFKFERDYKQVLTYEFVRSFPLSISSMPVSYSGNDLLKCTVSMSYIRYIQTGPVGLSVVTDNDEPDPGSFSNPNSILSRAIDSINSLNPLTNLLR